MRPEIHAPDAIEPALDMLESFIATRLEEGAGFEPGETILCGWMWFLVEEAGGKPTVVAPELGVMPMQFQANCSNALNMVLGQRYLCDSFGLSYGWCDARQAALCIKGIGECEEVFMNRQGESKDQDSGWYFGASDNPRDPNEPGSLEWRSLWELSCLFPRALEFFLLPPGHQATLHGRLAVLHDFEPLTPKPESYFATKYP
ncbi:MAG: hypothetical protein ACI8W8_002140 [Rhodothermales bacterium]|jgi:hypothetical protein